MANTTFYDLTNKLLRRLHEVEIAQTADFQATVGTQSLAKDAINASLNQINAEYHKWPFNATSGSQVLTVGTEEYLWPSDLKLPDWNSFFIQNSTALNTNTVHLAFIDRNEWERNYKALDDDAGTSGRSVPSFVFVGHLYGFGLSPSPDQTYTVNFNYWSLPAALVNWNDTPTVPSAFDEVIIQNAIYHFYMFRDNTTQATEAEAKGEKLLGKMRTILINSEDRVSSGLIPRSGMPIPYTYSPYFYI